jgi:hypothetical protein
MLPCPATYCERDEGLLIERERKRLREEIHKYEKNLQPNKTIDENILMMLSHATEF